jgi:hypothetical protein
MGEGTRGQPRRGTHTRNMAHGRGGGRLGREGLQLVTLPI